MKIWWHVFFSQHAMENIGCHSMTQKKTIAFVWWCDILIHIILIWDLIISMLEFYDLKLFSATCEYLKLLKTISLKMS
jgi:hypothetical protein